VKENIVARYGYIDKAEDAKQFRPLLPKEVLASIEFTCIHFYITLQYTYFYAYSHLKIERFWLTGTQKVIAL